MDEMLGVAAIEGRQRIDGNHSQASNLGTAFYDCRTALLVLRALSAFRCGRSMTSCEAMGD